MGGLGCRGTAAAGRCRSTIPATVPNAHHVVILGLWPGAQRHQGSASAAVQGTDSPRGHRFREGAVGFPAAAVATAGLEAQLRRFIHRRAVRWCAAVHHLLFLFVSVTWSLGFLLMAHATRAFGPLTVGGLRVVEGALVLLLLLPFTAHRWRPRGGDWWRLVAVGIIGYAVGRAVS